MIEVADFWAPLDFGGEPYFEIFNLRRGVELFGVDTDPDYQRGHVWTRTQQRKFVGHLISGGPTFPLVVNTGPGGDGAGGVAGRSELVDGKQRLAACLAWADGEIYAALPDGRRVWAEDLDEVNRRKLGNRAGLKFGLVRLTREECLAYYIRLNAGGTVHSSRELGKVYRLLTAERRKRGPA